MDDNNDPTWIPVTCHKRKSFAWNHFLQHKDNGKSKCKMCAKQFSAKVSTSVLLFHLNNIHNIVKERGEQKAEGQRVQQSLITKVFAKKNKISIEMAVCKLACVDRITFSAIASSEEIQLGLAARSFDNIPKTRKAVKKMVMDFAKEKKQETKEELLSLLAKGQRFSLTLDEVTSTRNRRYLTINLHLGGEEIRCLGKVRISDSMPAKRAVTLLNNALARFGLNEKDHIVSITTDGASVMRKMGRLLDSEHCERHAHGVHLAVCDVLYQGASETDTKEEEKEEVALTPGEEQDERDEEDSPGMLEEVVTDGQSYFIAEYNEVIKKERKIARFFRKSLVSNDKLQD